MADRIRCACGKLFDWDTGMYPACDSCVGDYEDALKAPSSARMEEYRAKRQVLVVDEEGARLLPASHAKRAKPDSRSVVTTRPLTGRQRDLLRLAVASLKRAMCRLDVLPAVADLTPEERSSIAGELRDLESLI